MCDGDDDCQDDSDEDPRYCGKSYTHTEVCCFLSILVLGIYLNGIGCCTVNQKSVSMY